MKKALDKLGFKYTEVKPGQELETKGNYGIHEKVDIRIEGNGNQNYSGAIGFKKNTDGTYTAVGDFYGLRTQDGQNVSDVFLKNEVTASAKQSEISERLLAMGFAQETCKEDSKSIEMTMTRWVP